MSVKFAIDGLFLTQTVTGIQRVAYELVKALDKIVKKNEIIIVAPNTKLNEIKLCNISLIKYGNKSGILWEQIDYAKYLRKRRLYALGLTNVIPLFYKHGIVMIHDVSYKVNSQFFTSKRDRLSAIWHRLNYFLASKSNMKILTVSKFSKSEIRKYYKVEKNRISVVYNGWQHMIKIPQNDKTLEKYPMLKEKNYYFSMASLAPNKNFKWIVNAAKMRPCDTFAIAGGGKMDNEGLENLHLLGYVTDEDAKSLMANCKAFIFPTYYEGFGLPPLEALACGAPQIIVSDTPCMHEIYGDYANYIDPNNPIKWIIYENREKNALNCLDKYSWERSAEKLYYEIMNNEIG